MKKLNHLFEAILGFVIPIPSIFIEEIIKNVQLWQDMSILRYTFIVFFKLLDLFFIILGLIVLIDGIQGIFTEKSIIPKIKEGVFG